MLWTRLCAARLTRTHDIIKKARRARPAHRARVGKRENRRRKKKKEKKFDKQCRAVNFMNGLGRNTDECNARDPDKKDDDKVVQIYYYYARLSPRAYNTIRCTKNHRIKKGYGARRCIIRGQRQQRA